MLNRLAQEGTYAQLSAYLKDHATSTGPEELADALIAAVLRKDAAIVELLLVNGANPNAYQRGGSWSALHCAVEHEMKPVIRLLVEYGADVNAPAKQDGFTPLHHAIDLEGDVATQAVHAASFGHPWPTPTAALTALLLELGADPRLRDSEGRTPLDLAERYHHTAAVALLRDRLQALGE